MPPKQRTADPTDGLNGMGDVLVEFSPDERYFIDVEPRLEIEESKQGNDYTR